MPNGYSNYGTGEDSLFRLQLRNALMSRLNRAAAATFRQPAAAVNPAGDGMGYTVRPTETSTGTQPTAAESHAFNERARDRALYGSYGKGGVERDRIVGTSLNEAAKWALSDKQRADVLQKNRELEIMAANAPFPVDDTTYREELGRILSGDPIGPAPVKQQSGLQEAPQTIHGQEGNPQTGGRITVPAGAPNAGVYEAPGQYVHRLGRAALKAGEGRPVSPARPALKRPAAPGPMSIDDALDDVFKNLTLRSSHGRLR
ncbi:conserved hypothetical protein [delta proteobacterium NaphS2]|nr:conserved hypothetical protein [delta proteobacterium NaphS2]